MEPVNEFWQTQNPRSSFGLAAARRARVAPCGHVGIDESAFLRFSIYWSSTGCPSLSSATLCNQSGMEGQRITLDPTAHTSFAERLAAAERARAGRGAAPDDEGERKGATTLFLYGALLVACAAVAGQTEFDEALERVAADAVLKLAHGGGVAVICAFSLQRSETRPGRRRGVQSNAAKYLLCALGANFAWRAYRLRGAAPLDEEGEVPEAAQALAAVILLLGLVGLLASCFEGAGQQRDRRRRAIAEYSRRAKVE